MYGSSYPDLAATAPANCFKSARHEGERYSRYTESWNLYILKASAYHGTQHTTLSSTVGNKKACLSSKSWTSDTCGSCMNACTNFGSRVSSNSRYIANSLRPVIHHCVQVA